jgi:hypothetical protein
MATWPVAGEFYWDYKAAWIGPFLEFARAHVRHINSWIIAQYGMTRVEVANVINNDWLHQLLIICCSFDAISLIASTASESDLAGFTARRSDETHRFGSLKYDTTVQKLNTIIRRWDLVQLPEDATCLATLPRSFHAICDVENNRNTRRYAFHESYCMHPYDAEQPEVPVVRQIQVVGYTPQSDVFVPAVNHRHDDSVCDEGSQKDVDLSWLRSIVESLRATSSDVAASSNVFAAPNGISCVQEGIMSLVALK